MYVNSENGGSRASLSAQRIYMPRSMKSSYSNDLNSPASQTSNQRSPALSSKGYTADFSEVESVSGSVTSGSRYFNSHKSLTDQQRSLTDSGLESGTGKCYAPSVNSCQGTDNDLVDDSRGRYEGELYKPTVHSSRTNVTVEIKREKGECHPRALPREDLPSLSSGDELETSSCASIPSFSGPRPAPRSSLRRKKITQSALSYTDDEDTSSRYSRAESKYSGTESLPRSILKSASYPADLSDDESLTTTEGGRFQRKNSRRQSKVRFEHVRKGEEASRKTISHYDEEVPDGKKKKDKKPSDVWALMSGPTIKPARNDPKRQSDRSRGSRKRSSSQDKARPSSRNSGQRRSCSEGRRSSSTDRKGSSSSLNISLKNSAASTDRRNYPVNESRRNDSSGCKDRMSLQSSSLDRQSNSSRSPKQSRKSNSSSSSNQKYSIGTEHVTLEMKDPPAKSAPRQLITLPPPTDKQKLLKRILIIGVPVLLLVVVVAVVIPIVL